MYSLFLDTTQSELVFILMQDNKIIEERRMPALKKQTEIFTEELNIFLNDHSIRLSEIAAVYGLTGPGSFTGIRVGLTFIKMLKVINSDLQVYLLNNLEFQITPNKKCASIITTTQNSLYLLINSDNNTKMIPEQYLNSEIGSEIIETINPTVIVKDYKNINYSEQFLLRRESFEKILETSSIKATYFRKMFG